MNRIFFYVFLCYILVDFTNNRDNNMSAVVTIVQNIINQLVANGTDVAFEIAADLMQCLEILYEYIPSNDEEAKMVCFLKTT